MSLFSSQPFGSLPQQPTNSNSTNAFGASFNPFGASALGSSSTQAQQQQQQQAATSTTNPASNAPGQPSTGPLSSWGLGSSTSTFTNAAQPGSLAGLGSTNLFQSQRPANQPAATAPAANATASTTSVLPILNGSAKFNDLPGPIQDLLNETESLIQNGLNAAKDLKGRKLGDEIVTNSNNSRQIFHDLTSSTNTLQADDLFAKKLRQKVDQAVQDVVVCAQIIDGFKESGIQHPNLKINAQYPIEFFNRLAEQMQERLVRYKSIVDQLNRKLAFSFQAQQSPQAITTTLQSQHASFIALAAKVAEVEGSLDEVKQQFSQLYRARTGSALDPFARVST
ncbi:hypothetical protein M408DRAFT_329950 [Serendipita vermifera MAFF 305830]|uniref:Uncharacterized protein n=1 Tax=Serendipita vermifera MAFF 305830 TaxID=933852 RepID=A0A0C2XEF2_SERVB|nr:hypothetical protein M408DRAFT_329950 [Serendipita vermifera MAFF 305830]